MLSAPVVAALPDPRSTQIQPLPDTRTVMELDRRVTIGRGSGRRGALPTGELRSEACAKCSSHGLVEAVGQALLLAAGDRLAHPHLPTARPSIPIPKGEKKIGRLRVTDRRPIMRSARVPVTKFDFPSFFFARWAKEPCEGRASPETSDKKRRNPAPDGVAGKFYIDTLVTSTRYALRGAPNRYLAGHSDDENPVRL